MDKGLSVLMNSGEGDSYWVLGDQYTFKVTGKDTNGAYTIIDQTIQPQNGPPPHRHHREDESFYVLEGTFSFLQETATSTLETGGFVYIPKGVLHTFKNIGDKPGRLLVLITPAGLEDFFYAIGTPVGEQAAPPPFDPALLDKVIVLAQSHQMDLILPE